MAWKLDGEVQDKAFYEDGYIWSPISDIDAERYEGLVYNISVNEDESYIVQGILAHNCTDISVAGRLKGLNPDDNTRSSLIWQTIRLLKQAKDDGFLPRFMILENVKNLVGKRFIDDFETFNSIIEEEFGYNCHYEVLNGCDCGIPQNRERVFAIYVTKEFDNGKITFPAPFDNGMRLKDVLEDEVEENFYINTPRAYELIQKLMDEGKIEPGEIYHGD